jgi:hypothetical protein
MELQFSPTIFHFVKRHRQITSNFWWSPETEKSVRNSLKVYTKRKLPDIFFFFQDLKRHIVDEALIVLINIIIIPHSGWDPNGPGGETVWSTVFRNASGILR